MEEPKNFAEQATLWLSKGQTPDPHDFTRDLWRTQFSKPALVLTPEDIRARVLKTGKPAYVLGRKQYRSGRNWFGGLPLLSNSMPWPRTILHQQPMHFWAQIDCSTLSGPHDLPNRGLLLFFFDLDARGATRADNGLGKVIFVLPDEIPSVERRPPDDLPLFSHNPGEQTSDYATRSVSEKFAAEPHEFASYDLQNVDLNWDLVTHENEFDARELATELTRDSRNVVIANTAPETFGRHALLGPADDVHPTHGKGVRLMCLGSDVDMDWQFGDGGVAEFWISPTDLRNRRFDLSYAMTC